MDMRHFLYVCVLLFSLGTGYVEAQMPERTEANVEKYKKICRDNIYKEMKGMYREAGGALVYPFLAPGSNQYLDMLWDWDSWLSNVALRQILLENGNDSDRKQAIPYEQGCVLNSLHYGGMDGWIPIWIERNAPTREEMLKKRNPWKSNMHKPTLAQHAAFIVRTLMGVVLLVYCFSLIKFKNPFDKNLIKQLLKIGYPIGIAMFLEFLGFNLITILVGREAGILAATHNICVTITSSAYVIPMSISAAIAIKVGFFNGAKNLKEIRRYSLSGTSMSVLFMLLCSVLLIAVPKQIFAIFTQNKEILALGLPILHIAAYYLMFDGLQVSLSGILKGLKMTKIASLTLIAGYWLFGLPFGYMLAYHYKMSLKGFWIGLAVSFLAMCTLFLIVIFRKFKQLKRVYSD